MKKEKTVLGKAGLILLLVYVILEVLNALPSPFILFSETYRGFAFESPAYTFQVVATILLHFYKLAIVTVWFIWLWKDKESLRIPAVMTCIYPVWQFVHQVMNFLLIHTYDDFSELFVSNWTLILSMIAWLAIVFGTETVNSVLFTVFRGMMLIIGMPQFVHSLKYHLENIVALYSLRSTVVEAYTIIYMIVPFAAIILFMVFLFGRNLFYKSDN